MDDMFNANIQTDMCTHHSAASISFHESLNLLVSNIPRKWPNLSYHISL